MAVVEYQESANTDASGVSNKIVPRILVVGAGPVGVRFITEYRRQNPRCHITLFGNEPYAPYNRVQLSNVLSRSKDYEDIVTELPLSTEHQTLIYQQANVTDINKETQSVLTQDGQRYQYDYLVLATGSKPHIPNIEGVDLKGVYSFRNLRDTEALLNRRNRARRIVVVGAGLLGLEAAKALTGNGTEIVLVQQSDRLMNRQLDKKASALLQEYVEALGVRVITQSGVRQIIADKSPSEYKAANARVAGVMTRDQELIECDTVLLCTGIRPNIDLAISASMAFGQGITVNDQLATSQKNIYALGECCEHDGMIYGIVAPGLEQASVLANCLSGGSARYQGTQLISTLKVVGESVLSMGEVAEVTQRINQQEISYSHKKSSTYRKLVVHRGHVIGACGIGEWPDSRRVQEAFLSQTYCYPWQRWYFSFTGKLWFGKEKQSVKTWPETAIICQCNQINRADLSAAIEQGCSSVFQLGAQTGAGTVCGSCQPLLQDLLGSDSKPTTVSGGLPIAAFSIVAIALALLLFLMPGIENVDSVQTPSLEFLWSDGFWKKVSGFSLLALALIGLVMTLRKRAQWSFLGNFSYWRVLHSVLGAVALVVLFFHTGAHLGENLNRWLMLNFLLVSIVGAVAGFSLHIAGKTSANAVQVVKKSSFWAHVVVVWPLPALLAAHIMSVYYF
jgi:nitrite reductase (NADH) large subunit